jgi:hypothetical protein
VTASRYFTQEFGDLFALRRGRDIWPQGVAIEDFQFVTVAG